VALEINVIRIVIRHPVPFFKLAIESETISNPYFSYFQWTIFFTFNPILISHYFLWKIFWTRIHDSKVRALVWLVRRKSTKFFTKSYFFGFQKKSPKFKVHWFFNISNTFFATRFWTFLFFKISIFIFTWLLSIESAFPASLFESD